MPEDYSTAGFKTRMRALLLDLHDHPTVLDEITDELDSAASTGYLFTEASDGCEELAFARAVYGKDHPGLDKYAAQVLFQLGDCYLSTRRTANAPEREGFLTLAALVALE